MPFTKSNSLPADLVAEFTALAPVVEPVDLDDED